MGSTYVSADEAGRTESRRNSTLSAGVADERTVAGSRVMRYSLSERAAESGARYRIRTELNADEAVSMTYRSVSSAH